MTDNLVRELRNVTRVHVSGMRASRLHVCRVHGMGLQGGAVLKSSLKPILSGALSFADVLCAGSEHSHCVQVVQVVRLVAW